MRIIGRFVRGEATIEDVLLDGEVCDAVKLMQTRTKKWSIKMGYTSKMSKVPEEVRDWINFFNEREFGRSATLKREMMDLVEKLTEIPISKYALSDGDKVIFERGVVLVPLGNDNGHNYSLGKPCCNFRDGDMFMKPNGELGDRLTRTRNLIRPATDDEVVTFVRKLITANADSALALFSSI